MREPSRRARRAGGRIEALLAGGGYHAALQLPAERTEEFERALAEATSGRARVTRGAVVLARAARGRDPD
ncbi:MAG: hypothetical protein ABR599_04625 [Gemmatimonadota bacterium]